VIFPKSLLKTTIDQAEAETYGIGLLFRMAVVPPRINDTDALESTTDCSQLLLFEEMPIHTHCVGVVYFSLHAHSAIRSGFYMVNE
jgi:hypothetical protein